MHFCNVNWLPVSYVYSLKSILIFFYTLYFEYIYNFFSSIVNITGLLSNGNFKAYWHLPKFKWFRKYKFHHIIKRRNNKTHFSFIRLSSKFHSFEYTLNESNHLLLQEQSFAQNTCNIFRFIILIALHNLPYFQNLTAYFH